MRILATAARDRRLPAYNGDDMFSHQSNEGLSTSMIHIPFRKNVLRGLIPALALLATQSLQAQSLADCTAIEDPDERLACFDNLAGAANPTGPALAPAPTPALTPAPTPTPIPAPAIAPTATSTTPSSAAAGAAAAATGTAVAGQSDPAVSGVSSYQDLFGLENEAAKKGIKEIQSRIIDNFDGWSGRTIFRLENGQVWQQSDVNSTLSWRGDSHPMATVKRKSFGSYMLGVEGVNKMVRVKRVK